MQEQVSSATPATPAAPPSAARPLRRDAARNRERLLQSARELFAERGLEVTLDDIARHAGVGVGTVYRHFPSKEALVEALFEEQVDRLVTLATQALEHEDPWEGLAGLLYRLSEEMTDDRGLREVVLSGTYGRDRVAESRDRIVPVMEALVQRAHDAGVLRPDVMGGDLPLIQHMLGAAALYAAPVRPAVWKRYLAVLLDGLRARPGLTPLTEPALSLPELDRLMHAPPAGGRRR